MQAFLHERSRHESELVAADPADAAFGPVVGPHVYRRPFGGAALRCVIARCLPAVLLPVVCPSGTARSRRPARSYGG
eukprot:6534367-Lingulodinium_polyedra.AAC.1